MNLDFLSVPMGWLVKIIYNFVAPIDNSVVSAYAIAIILSTIVIKLLMVPLTIKQNKSMKVMKDLGPQIEDLKEKYGKDPQTFQRKQMELYKENNYSPFAGCLPLLIQLPLIMAFFYVIQQPVRYVFGGDQAFFDGINKSFIWIKDLTYAAGHVFTEGTYANQMNGIYMGFNIPLIGQALPILAGISAFTTYLTSKMMSTAQAGAMNEQQQASQNMMSIMMPIMIFFMSLNFPSGLVLYWVVGNVFQLLQQIVFFKIADATKNSEVEKKDK